MSDPTAAPQGFPTDSENLQTILDLARWAASRFDEYELFLGHGTQSYLVEAAWLVLETLRLPIDLEQSWWSARVTESERAAVVENIRLRCETRKPTAYLVNRIWFAGLPFYVDERVLIPRSPFAELIMQRFEAWMPAGSVRSALDVGTGSGCMAIALARYFEDASITASDIDPGALAVAARNVNDYQLGERIELIQSDLLEGLGDARFDLIISNPPYVAQEEAEDLPAEFHHEPAHALFAPERGLALVERLLEQAPDHLNEHGWLFVEDGNSAHWLEEQLPGLPVEWVNLENGGEGIFAIDAASLRSWRATRRPGDHADGQDAG
ncbi:MAG: 50S ribosomal protein L3 N(5)-glutamine methyltransferase [Halothiobacillaceae bacterium]